MTIRLLTSFLLGLPLLGFCKKTELKVVDFFKANCELDSNSRRQIRERVIAKKRNPDNVEMRIGVWAICCADFKPVAKLQMDTLFLDVEDTHLKSPCECSCYYQFTYKIKGLKSDPLEIKFGNRRIDLSNERYLTYAPLYRLVGGDTVDRVDKYGLRQGKWMTSHDSLFISEYYVYNDGLISAKVDLFSSGKVKRETIREILKETNSESHYGGLRTIIEYYDSGVKKRQCQLDVHDMGLCKEWDDKGSLIYEGSFRK